MNDNKVMQKPKITRHCWKAQGYTEAVCWYCFIFIVSISLIRNVIKLNSNRVILLSRYILSIEKAEEIEEYVGDLLQGTDGRKGHFIDELLIRWKKTQRQAADNTSLFLLKEPVSAGGKWIKKKVWLLPLNVFWLHLHKIPSCYYQPALKLLYKVLGHDLSL